MWHRFDNINSMHKKNRHNLAKNPWSQEISSTLYKHENIKNEVEQIAKATTKGHNIETREEKSSPEADVGIKC